MNRNKKIFFIGLPFLLGILMLSYLNYTVSRDRQILIANRLYSPWSIELIEDMIPNQLIELLPKNSHIFFEHTSCGNIRSFYQQGNWQPPMHSGEFFNENSLEYSAVVGRHHLGNDETTITIEGVSFEIIGILGTGYPSVLDHLILLNTRPEKMSIERVVIDTRRQTDMEKFNPSFRVTNLQLEGTALDFIENTTLNEVIRRNILIISAVLSYLIGYIYLKMIEQKTKVFELIGRTTFSILMTTSLEIAIISITCFSFVWLLDQLIGHGIVLYHGYLYGVLLVLIVISYQVNFSIKRLRKIGGGI